MQVFKTIMFLLCLVVGFAVWMGVRSSEQKKSCKTLYEPRFESSVIKAPHDPRGHLLTQFFEKYGCPIKPLVNEFIEAADQNNLDWRLLPAISLQESSCGKRYLYNNLFGFGSNNPANYPFNSFSHSIAYVASAIAGNNPKERAYRNLGQDTDKILWLYNGTVNSQYPGKITTIMNQINPKE